MAPSKKTTTAAVEPSREPKDCSTLSLPQATATDELDHTIAAKLEAEYLASRPYQTLLQTKGVSALSPAEKTAYTFAKFLETGVWRSWPEPARKEFWKGVETHKIPTPLDKPRDLGRDRSGRDIGSYTVKEYGVWEREQRELGLLWRESRRFRARARGDGGEIEDERNRRKLIARLEKRKMRMYEGDPTWDDVVPIPQEDGEGALAQIAYTEEYAEAMGYLRAVMASGEHSPRTLALTEHIISLNAAHYTVWLFRASTLFALKSSIPAELEWLNEVALNNQKNYQIWHHRQLLIDHLYPTVAGQARQELVDREIAFMTEMFDNDGKNYHVWSYRQFFVRKFNLFNEAELKRVEVLLRQDVRNNSAWSHRFFIVFSNPEYCKDVRATEPDPGIPESVLDREIEFGKAACFEAPQNQSPWNYLRGVLRKGGRKLGTLSCFAEEFVKLDGEETVKSSHALDFLADAWTEEGKVEDADKALRLLGEKYDRIRKNYWEWRRSSLEV